MNAPPYPYPPAPPPAPKRGVPTWAIVLICTAGAFVLLVPIVAVLGVYGVRKYIVNAKTAEARSSLGQIAKDAAATYDAKTGFCASARAVPVDGKMLSGKKYMSAPSDWGSPADEALHKGFVCLGFSLDQPQYYQYVYESPGPKHDAFAATAHGDLDGDGVTSSFVIAGSAIGGVVTVAPTITETSYDE